MLLQFVVSGPEGDSLNRSRRIASALYCSGVNSALITSILLPGTSRKYAPAPSRVQAGTPRASVNSVVEIVCVESGNIHRSNNPVPTVNCVTISQTTHTLPWRSSRYREFVCLCGVLKRKRSQTSVGSAVQPVLAGCTTDVGGVQSDLRSNTVSVLRRPRIFNICKRPK